MSESSQPVRCTHCGAILPPGVPENQCPSCLMAQVLLPTQMGEAAPAAVPLPTPEELSPHFPQLEILSFIGRGGMGAVYKARQKSLNRLVALKLLAPERADDPQFAARFEREAQALAALNHPHIVGVYDFGQAGGYFYLLMEYVDGVNLRQLLQTRRLAPREALSIVPPVCEALQCAHERGIVHRDIKPENLLMDKAGKVKIADFGIAKIVHSGPSTEGGEAGTLPQGGVSQPLGTPDYAAPEQAEGTADHRADIYSLGVVLYEMLTGERPQENITPPSKRVQVDIRIDEIVLRALERVPELRFATAAEFRTQVEAATMKVEGPRPVSQAQPPSRLSWTAVTGMVVWMVSFVALALAAAMLISLFRRQIPPGAGMPAVAPWWAHASIIITVLPGVLGALVATFLGWLAIGQIRRSSGRLHGMSLAFFDALLLPLAVTFGAAGVFWMQVARGVARTALRAGGEESSWIARVILQQPLSLALLMTLISWALVAFFSVRWLWRLANGREASAKQLVTSPKAVPRWVVAGMRALCVLSLAAIFWRSSPPPVGQWTGVRIATSSSQSSGPAMAQVEVERVERREQTVWILLHPTSSTGTTMIRPEFVAQLSALPAPAAVSANDLPSMGRQVAPPGARQVALHLAPGPAPYETRMQSRDVPELKGTEPVWLGFVMPSVAAAEVAVTQIAKDHLHRVHDMTSERPVLLLFQLKARGFRPADDEVLAGHLFFGFGRSAADQAASAKRSRVLPGRVVELVVPDPAPGTACLLDFESGRFIEPSPALAERLMRGGAEIGEAGVQWARESGADVSVRMPDGEALRFYEGFALTRSIGVSPPLAWDQFTDRDILATLEQATFERRQRFLNDTSTYYATPAKSPTALAFMTREGSLGLLEILGRDASMPGIRLRYRLTANTMATERGR